MGDNRNTSQPSAAAALLTSGQDVQDYTWMLVDSRQSEVRCNIYLIKKYMRELYVRTGIDKSRGELGNISKMEKSLAQLVDLTKSMLEQIRSLQPTVHKAVNPYPSLPMDSEHASLTLNQGEAIRSVYLFVSHYGIQERTNAIYGVKFKHGGGVTHEPPVIGLVDKFCEGEKYDVIGMKAAHIFNHSKLYVVAQSGGYIIDTKTMSRCSSFPPPVAYKSTSIVLSAYDKLYCLAIPLEPIRHRSFKRYDHDMNVWEEMPSCPFYNYRIITGYAVCYGVILFSLCGGRKNFDVLAFHISRNQWRQVEVDTSVDYAPFQGRAVVVGKTIYSLQENEFIAFSFRMDKGDDNSIVYSLSQLFILQGLQIVRPPLPFEIQSEYLVHLGNQDFFHVKTGHCYGTAQYLCITTFQIVVGEGERDMIKTINSTVHSVDLECSEYFNLVFCFMPECGDYEPIEDKSVTSMNQPKQEENHSGIWQRKKPGME
ncbi:uncharacterized protein Pyn_21085 [Prunus yedoensis var. nudiflora]|uniref:Uncharacterized protein n=1 Tax=Prunus yedoensis var. nudiflora TaxID=2094558 RepID=A0A314UIP8_PRUYE|nr:uncharacterized protein Pyn_21085 [Prunus yedoensis var. nudiflora]